MEQFSLNMKVIIGEKTKYEVESNGNLIKNILANKITAANYGDKVQYTANEVSDWRIFYNDGKNVFLISTDCVSNKLIDKDKTKISEDFLNRYEYNIKWDNISQLTFEAPDKPSLFKATGYTLNGKYGNSKTTAIMLNTNNYINFVDPTKASYAIATPTLEMWIASWNEKYSDTLTFGTDVKGYKIGANAQTLGESISDSVMQQKDGYKVEEANNMYYPHKSAFSGTYGYWLAAPSYTVSNSSNALMNVEVTGLVGFNGQGWVEYGFRPVVCLKETTTGKKTGDIWVLE